jgi:L-alanine-DL-glutamate epimerase-like enolase superfamily enzyme
MARALDITASAGAPANMHLMAAVMHLAKPVEVADNPSLNVLFRHAPEPQNGALPVPSGPGLELDLDKLEPRIKPL